MEDQKKLYALMAVVERQQEMLDALMAKLKEEREALAKERGSVQQIIDQSVKQSMSGVAETVSKALQGAIQPSADTLKESVRSAYEASNQLSASMRRVQSAWTWRIVWLSVSVLLIVGVSAYGMVWWERSQIKNLQETRQSLQADINRMQPVVKDLEKRGGRLVWNNCGGKWCLQVESQTWHDGKGVPLAIPRGF